MKHVVIVGGGFAGVRVARRLHNVPGVKVTLISDQTEFRYSPALYRTATGGLRRVSTIPVKTMISHLPDTEFVSARMTKINREKRIITTTGGKNYHYDYAVLAIGVVTSYFNIPGLEQFSYSIKSAHEVERLKRHLHEQMTSREGPDKHYVIVGAGPTGVELAAALGQYLKKIAKKHRIRRSRLAIELIEAADRVLPTMAPGASRRAHAKLRRLGVKVMVGQKVEAATSNALKVSGRMIPTHTVIWTAGVTNNPFFKRNNAQFELDKRGKVIVGKQLMIDQHTYVIGDNAAIEFGGLAQTAIKHANFVAKHIARTVRYKHTSLSLSLIHI
ncbi:MAG: FAD-dependent oxidoreductase, partial [Candidatus Saccharibacteria bacterium]|nr:FAD-dependent oxidoreductase [Candidatus Saccharibacteria bacterium]